MQAIAPFNIVGYVFRSCTGLSRTWRVTLI
jgi:hypothetical protein